MMAVRVIQACFPERKPPAGAPVSRFARALLPVAAVRPAHAARLGPAISRARAAQPAFVDPRFCTLHSAAIARHPSQSRLHPHPAKVRASSATTPHAASLQAKANVRAFRTPHGFLAGQKSGDPLSPALRRQMEGYFDVDF